MQSDILFVQPSFLRGFARVVDLWGNFDVYNGSQNTKEADELALSSDMYMISQDFRHAFDSTIEDLEQNQKGNEKED